MTITAQQIAEWVNGDVIGNPDVSIDNIAKIEEAKPNTIAFLAKAQYFHYLEKTEAGIVLISKNLVTDIPVNPTLIAVEDAHQSFVTLLNLYNQFTNQKQGISEQVSIHENTKIGENPYIGSFVTIEDGVEIGNNVKIYPNCYIGNNVKIGNNVTLEPNVVVFNDTIIGNEVSIHSGTIIGSDGFGFLPTEKGYEKVPQLGNVIIENRVEIGSNCTIDRATMGSTIIKEGNKIDNLIQIAHNVELGKHNVIAAQAGIAGSTKIGEWNMIGGQVGIVGHIKIGNQVKIQAQSGVNKEVKDNQTLYGSPAIDAMDYRKNYVHFRNFQKLVERINELEKKVQNNK